MSTEETKNKELTIDDVITLTKSGMSNEIMRPAIRKWIDNKEALQLLYDNYPDQFNHTRRYLTISETKIVNDLFGVYKEDPEKTALIHQLKPTRVGVTKKLIADRLVSAISERDVRMILLLRKHFPKMFNSALEKLKAADRNIIIQGLERIDAKIASGELQI